MDLMKAVEKEFTTQKDYPEFSAGDTVTVYYIIKEGSKERTQLFKGVVLKRNNAGINSTFTVRKMSGNVGVERVFPDNSPVIQKIEVNKRGLVRRSKIYYFRQLRGKKAKIKEKIS